MKTVEYHLGREEAKELLGRIDQALSSLDTKATLDEVVKLLNGNVPSYTWVGVYTMNDGALHLAAWSGPAPTVHDTIPLGKGVCGYAAKAGRTEIVSDVSKDPRYLECFLSTKSEIVVPIFAGGKVVGELDIDGDVLGAFSTTDKEFLEAVARKISAHWPIQSPPQLR
ncbi:MAG: GAF domain-containing protein [Thaumarchaeota archaeon]|nr:GAF domain-containing protein [Nitrososphaerota archaeon]